MPALPDGGAVPRQRGVLLPQLFGWSVSVKWLKLIPRALRQRIVLGRIRALLEKLGLPREAVEELMSGWKVWAGGIGGILTGALVIVNNIASGDFSFDALKEGLGLISIGFSALGLGHKLEKASNANVAAIQASATKQAIATQDAAR